MTAIVIREIDGTEPPAKLYWDSVWLEEYADWQVGDDGAFTSDDPIGTAVILCLCTDAHRPADEPSPDGTSDRRGWFGDGFDLDREAGEREMGSLLWLLERAPQTEQTRRRAERYAQEALQTLIDQRAASQINVTAAIEGDRLTLTVQVYEPGQSDPFQTTIAVSGSRPLSPYLQSAELGTDFATHHTSGYISFWEDI